MSAAILYRVVDEHPYLDRESEQVALSAEEAATQFEQLTGERFDAVLAELDESCSNCAGGKRLWVIDGPAGGLSCPICGGDGKRADPIEWEDQETGRTVTLRREVSP